MNVLRWLFLGFMCLWVIYIGTWTWTIIELWRFLSNV